MRWMRCCVFFLCWFLRVANSNENGIENVTPYENVCSNILSCSFAVLLLYILLERWQRPLSAPSTAHEPDRLARATQQSSAKLIVAFLTSPVDTLKT